MDGIPSRLLHKEGEEGLAGGQGNERRGEMVRVEKAAPKTSHKLGIQGSCFCWQH